MQCPKCSFENRPDARFCKRCGQALLAETVPSMPSLPTGVVCPACGASTAKPGARFCLRCGKPLPSAVPIQPPAPPSPPAATQPVMSPAPTVRSPSARPPGGAVPPPQPPPPPSPPPPSPPPRKRRPAKRSLKWVWIAVAVGALACVVVLVAATVLAVWQGWLTIPIGGLPGAPAGTPVVAPTDVVTAVPTERPPEAPTELPPPEQGPFVVEVSFSSEEVKVGEEVVVTVNVTNNSPDPVGELRYRLAGDWDLFLEPMTEVEVLQGEDIPPGETGSATFTLKGKQAGEAGVRVSVMMIVRVEPPVEKELVSERRVIQVTP